MDPKNEVKIQFRFNYVHHTKKLVFILFVNAN